MAENPFSLLSVFSVEEMDDDDGVYRLEAPQIQKGGLVIKKKGQEGSNSVFKVPEVKKSLLGLDRLAGMSSYHGTDNILFFSGDCPFLVWATTFFARNNLFVYFSCPEEGKRR